MPTPIENLQQANDDYHEAVGEILADETVLVEARAKFGKYTNIAFDMMREAKTQIESFYKEES